MTSHPRSVASGTIVEFSVSATNVQWFHLQVRDAVTGSLLFERLKNDLSGNFQPNYAFSGSFTMPNDDVTFTIDGGDQSLGLISYIMTINEVAAQNRPPIVVPHQATVTSGQTVAIPIVGPTLDHDPDGDQLIITAPQIRRTVTRRLARTTRSFIHPTLASPARTPSSTPFRTDITTRSRAR
jgi:hypothetical protein